MAKKAKLKLDEATIKALMGYSVATGSVKFKPEIEGVDDEFKPIFKVRNLTNEEYNTMKTSIKTDDGEKDDTAETDRMMELVRKCLLGWSNFIDLSTLDYVDYIGDKNGCDIETFKLISDGLKLQIFQFIMKFNGM